MRGILCLAVALAVGCTAADNDENGLKRSDVEGITEGSGQGVVFTGTWAIELKVQETNCDVIPGVPGLPQTNEMFSEDVPLAQNNGELTRAVDDVGELYLFRGSVEKNGDFRYGISTELTGGIEFVEITEGKMKLGENGTSATLTGFSHRRYQAALFDCKAEMSITGERTIAGGGGEGNGGEGEGDGM
ncbi:MAG: hypothetical protein H6704_11460 [Myxococcales bacterium]|nr:hypothetical protein [Myxococcales bacterium]